MAGPGFCDCIPGHRVDFLTGRCIDCGLSEMEAAEGIERDCPGPSGMESEWEGEQRRQIVQRELDGIVGREPDERRAIGAAREAELKLAGRIEAELHRPSRFKERLD